MKAAVKYNSGLMLIIPKSGNAPMLFLEFASTFRAGINLIHHVNKDELDVFKIRLNATKETYLQCAEYINLNL